MKHIKIALTATSLVTVLISTPSFAEDMLNGEKITHAIETLTSYDAKTTAVYYKDLDEDNVKDQYDHCLNTLMGVQVDQHGCEPDHDKDSVVDRIDQCPDTPLGVAVNRFGCENDEDADGVPDSKDKCPGTPKGATVDNRGCEIIDVDQDNINDNVDVCLDTPLNSEVNRHGCEPQEFVLTNIIFDTASHEILESQQPILKYDAAMLSNLKDDEVVLITGHTDYIGEDDMNLRLSWRRASSTKDFIIQELGHLEEKVYITGFGENLPIADNTTVEGRQENRRIELQVITIDQLPERIELTLPFEMISK